MASLIDPSKPETGNPTTESVRQNFQHAKNEIEALQAESGGTKNQIRVGVSTNVNGSAYPYVPRFTTVIETNGTAITYDDSSTNGASFTINETGIYAITYTSNFGAAYNVGISLNANGATPLLSLTNAERLAIGSHAPDYSTENSYTGWFQAGDVIRPHMHTAIGSNNVTAHQMSVVKIR